MAPCRAADEGGTPRAAYTAAAFAAVRGRGACVEGRGGAHVEVGCRRTKPGVRASIQREGSGAGAAAAGWDDREEHTADNG